MVFYLFLLLLSDVTINCDSYSLSLKKIKFVDITTKYKGYVFHLNDFEVYTESDVKEIETNCSNAITVHMTLTISNVPTPVIGYLYKNGHIEEKLIQENLCKRTKRYFFQK